MWRKNAKQHVISKFHLEKMMTHILSGTKGFRLTVLKKNYIQFSAEIFRFRPVLISLFHEKFIIKFRPLKKLKEMSMLTTP